MSCNLGVVAALAVLLLPAAPLHADEAREWKLLVVTAGADVKITPNLTEHECKFASDRVMGLPATEEEKAKAEQKHQEEIARGNRLNREVDALDKSDPQCKITRDGGVTGEHIRCDGTRHFWWVDGVYSAETKTTIKFAECFR